MEKTKTETGKDKQEKTVLITPPKFETVTFNITGTAPLVVHRFSSKTKLEMLNKMETQQSPSTKRVRKQKDGNELFNEARYVSAEGWDGFNAGSIRSALISACRLVGFKMTLAKLSLFVVADGYDALEPQIPLVKILGCKPVRQDDMARVETGQPYVTIRAAYHKWKAKVTLQYDKDQFNLEGVTALMMRVGMQVGIGEGRPDSKNSAGMGWGTFSVEQKAEVV